MHRILKLSAIPLIVLASACANTGSNYQPVIDGPVNPNYNADLAACQQLAASQPVNSAAAGNVVAGAGAAAAGTALVNNTGSNVRDAAIVGAVAGLARGLALPHVVGGSQPAPSGE